MNLYSLKMLLSFSHWAGEPTPKRGSDRLSTRCSEKRALNTFRASFMALASSPVCGFVSGYIFQWMRTAASGLARPNTVALAMPRAKPTSIAAFSVTWSSRVARVWPSISWIRGESRRRSCIPLFSMDAWSVSQRARQSTVFCCNASRPGAPTPTARIFTSFSGSMPTDATSAFANGTEPEASAGTPMVLPLRSGQLLQGTVRRHHEAINRLAGLNVEALDLHALLPADDDLLGAEGDDLQIARGQLLHAGRGALDAGHRHVEPFLLPVAQRLRQRRMRRVADRDVLGGHGEHDFLQRLVLRQPHRAPHCQEGAHDHRSDSDAPHRRSFLSGPKARAAVTH